MTTVDAVALCPACLHINAPEDTRCARCWGKLAPAGRTTRQNAAQRISQRKRAKLRRWALLSAGPAALLIVAGIYVGGMVIQFPVPQPTSRVPAFHAPGNWPLAGGNAAHTSAVPEDGPVHAVHAWQFEVAAEQLASPSIAEGVVYVAAGDGRLLALDAVDGSVQWEAPLGGPQGSAPAITERSVYMALRDGRVLALDRASGDLRWSHDTGGSLLIPPLVHEGVLYVSRWFDGVLALDAVTGEHLWEYETESRISAPPAIQGEIMAVPTDQGRVHIIDLHTGRHRMIFDAGKPVDTSPVFAGDHLLISTTGGLLFGVDWTDLEYPLERAFRSWRSQFFYWGFEVSLPVPKGYVWSAQLGQAALSAPALTGDTAFVTTASGVLHAVETTTGETRWTHTAEAAINAPPVAAGAYVYIGTTEGNVHVLDRVSGEAMTTIASGPSVDGPIIIADGTLYVVARNAGTLTALR